MALILNIESSTSVCSVCLSKNGKKINGRETHEKNAHSKILTVFIEDILKEENLKAKELDAVAVSKGPGSYTGLRIGVSAAKGMAYGAGIPLIAVNTLLNMSFGAGQKINAAGNYLFAPLIDARRMEVYTQLFDKNLIPVNKTEAKIIDETSFSKELEENTIYFFGDGADKCRQIIKHKNAVFMDDMHPSSDFMIPFSEQAFKEKKFEDIAYFEPFYLKNFIASIPTKNIYG